MKKGLATFVVVLLAAHLLSGCANRATARVDPSANLATLKTLHVVKIPEETAGISTLIADKLRAKGYSVTTSTSKESDADALVTYIDRWMWDITMYLLELTITFRESKSDFALATGNSLHGSLTRKSPAEMVDEVIDNIFKESEK